MEAVVMVAMIVAQTLFGGASVKNLTNSSVLPASASQVGVIAVTDTAEMN